MDSGISGTYPLYCHWCWIFPPPGLALVVGGFSGSLQNEITQALLESLSHSQTKSSFGEGSPFCCLISISDAVFAPLHSFRSPA